MAQARRINRTKQALLGGESVMVAEINRIPSPQVVEAVALAGFASCWVDMEHSHIGLDDLSNMILAARAHGLATIDSSFQDDKSSAESLSAACKSSRELVRLGLSASRPLPARFALDPPKTFPPPASSELFSSLLLVARGSMGRSLITRL